MLKGDHLTPRRYSPLASKHENHPSPPAFGFASFCQHRTNGTAKHRRFEFLYYPCPHYDYRPTPMNSSWIGEYYKDFEKIDMPTQYIMGIPYSSKRPDQKVKRQHRRDIRQGCFKVRPIRCSPIDGASRLSAPV